MALSDEQLEQALREADRLAQQGDEQAQQDAVILAQEFRRRSTETKEEDGPSGFMPFLNKSIAQIAGGPVDITNALLNQIGIGSERPVGGSESIREGMAAIGAPTPDRDPETFGETAGSVTGELATFLLPLTATATVLSKGSGITSNISKKILDDFINKPKRTLTAEALAVPGITTARRAAESGDLSPSAQVLAEVASGVVPAVGVQAIPRLPILNLGLKSIIPFTKAGAKSRAARRVQSLAEDPTAAARRIEDLQGTDLLPAARSEEPGLMALEETVIRETPQQQAKMSTRRSEVMSKLSNKITESGNAASTQEFFKLRAERLGIAMDARIEKATEEAAETLRLLETQGLNPSAMRTASNQVVKDALERGLNDAKKQQRELWSAIPRSAKGEVKQTIKTYKEILAETPSAQTIDIPVAAKRIIGPTVRTKSRARVKKTTVNELQGLYVALGEEATTARAGGQLNKARIAEKLRESIIEDLDNFDSNDAFVSETISAARAFSRQMNEKFNRGPVGKILRFSREGGDQVPTDLTIPTLLPAGVKSKIGFEALQKATDDPLALEGISNYLKAQFLSKVIDPTTGRLRSQAVANNFLRQNEEILDLVPTVRAQLITARNADDALRLITKRSDALRKSLDNPRVSSFAAIINQPADVAMRKVFNSASPSESMQLLVNAAKKDTTGDALNGLRSSVSEYLVDTITTTRLDSQGRPVINGLEFKRILQDTKLTDTLRQVFNPQEMAELVDVAQKMASLQLQSSAAPLTSITDDRAGFIIEKIAQILGAKLGAKLSSTSGGSIQSASIGSSVARKWLNDLTADKARQLLIDAVRDPELMVTLLQHSTANKANERVIRSYMLSPIGSRLVDPELLEQAKEESKQDK